MIDVEKLLRDVFRPEDLVPLPKSGMNPLLAICFRQNALFVAYMLVVIFRYIQVNLTWQYIEWT